MGQRHQVYVRLPETRKGPSRVVGIHHQWLYGHSAVRSLGRFIKFIKAQDSFYADSLIQESGESILNSIYSIEIETGYYHRVHQLYAECEDPNRGDNNDGITIIDLKDRKNPKYCFMSLHHLECDKTTSDGIVNYKPMSGFDYFSAYYPNGLKMNKHTSNDERMVINQLNESLKLLDGLKLLTKKQVQEIFPKMNMVAKKAK